MPKDIIFYIKANMDTDTDTDIKKSYGQNEHVNLFVHKSLRS